MRHIALSLVLALITCVNLSAQDSLQKPAAITSPVIDNANPTTVTAPVQVRKPRRRKPTAADSLRIADSIARVQQGLNNNSAFNIGNTANAQTPSTVDSNANATAQTPIQDVPRLSQSNNPFEILRGEAAVDSSKANQATLNNQTPAASLLDKRTYSKNFIFWVFMVVLAFMALVVANMRSSIRNAFDALYSDTALRQIFKEPVIGWGGISYLTLYSLFWINAGIFVYLLLGYFGVKSPFSQLSTFLLCVGGVSLVFLIKHVILYIIASIFPIEKEIRTYNFIILTAGILLGLTLMPLNLFIAFAPSGISEIMIFVTLGAIIFVYLIRSLRGLAVASPYVFTNNFHFLLYLCSVEIAPVLILIKLVSTTV